MSQRTLAVVMAGTMLLLLSGCVPFRKKRVAGSAPVVPPPKTGSAPAKPELPPPPPKVEGGASPSVPTTVSKLPPTNVPGPPTKAKNTKKTRAGQKPAPVPSDVAPVESGAANPTTSPVNAATPPPANSNVPSGAAAAGGAAGPPQLGDFLSDDQRRRLTYDANENISRARKVLSQIDGKPLSVDQQDSVQRVKTFLQQAEEAREKDPQTALQLAQRADVLARDLAKTITR